MVVPQKADLIMSCPNKYFSCILLSYRNPTLEDLSWSALPQGPQQPSEHTGSSQWLTQQWIQSCWETPLLKTTCWHGRSTEVEFQINSQNSNLQLRNAIVLRVPSALGDCAELQMEYLSKRLENVFISVASDGCREHCKPSTTRSHSSNRKTRVIH